MLRIGSRWFLFSSAHYSTKREPHPRFDRES
jgi:hypothetical protein